MPAVLLDGDLVVLTPAFGHAIAVGTLAVPVKGSALASFDGRALCVERDLTSVTASVAYSTPSCPVPGSARITVESLNGSQRSTVVTDSGKPVVLAVGRVAAMLEVVVPAIGPPPSSIPDATRKYPGSGVFQVRGPAPTAE